MGNKAYNESPGCAPVRQLRFRVQICLKKTKNCLAQGQHEELGRIAWPGLPGFITLNRLDYQHITQKEVLSRSSSFWRMEQEPRLLRESDGVSAVPLKVRHDKALLDFTHGIT